ncbi:hypothetical protein ECG_09447 [Echinococcus granulosus]|nr:hypothetical protein ECG_09447 [Echinococcus granulosus]
MKTALTFVTLSLVLFIAWCSAKPELLSGGTHHMDMLASSGKNEKVVYKADEQKDGKGKDAGSTGGKRGQLSHLPSRAACAVGVLPFSIRLLICFIHYFLILSTRRKHIHVMRSTGEEFGFGAAPSDEEDEREGDKGECSLHLYASDGEAALILPPI